MSKRSAFQHDTLPRPADQLFLLNIHDAETLLFCVPASCIICMHRHGSAHLRSRWLVPLRAEACRAVTCRAVTCEREREHRACLKKARVAASVQMLFPSSSEASFWTLRPCEARDVAVQGEQLRARSAYVVLVRGHTALHWPDRRRIGTKEHESGVNARSTYVISVDAGPTSSAHAGCRPESQPRLLGLSRAYLAGEHQRPLKRNALQLSQLSNENMTDASVTSSSMQCTFTINLRSPAWCHSHPPAGSEQSKASERRQIVRTDKKSPATPAIFATLLAASQSSFF